jgi:hypothetical protein
MMLYLYLGSVSLNIALLVFMIRRLKRADLRVVIAKPWLMVAGIAAGPITMAAVVVITLVSLLADTEVQ